MTTTRDVICDITCTQCNHPVTVGSRDLEDNVKTNHRYICWTCMAEREDV